MASSQGKKLKEGMYVWVKDPSIAGSDLYTKGHILNINSNKVHLILTLTLTRTRYTARLTLSPTLTPTRYTARV